MFGSLIALSRCQSSWGGATTYYCGYTTPPRQFVHVLRYASTEARTHFIPIQTANNGFRNRNHCTLLAYNAVCWACWLMSVAVVVVVWTQQQTTRSGVHGQNGNWCYRLRLHTHAHKLCLEINHTHTHTLKKQCILQTQDQPDDLVERVFVTRTSAHVQHEAN